MSRREGRAFRRCRTCSRTVTSKSKRCDHTDQPGAPCGGEVAWAYAVDVAIPGSKERKRRVRSGFDTKKEALAALRDVQQADAIGKLVEPTRMTVSEYLVDWLAASRGPPRSQSQRHGVARLRDPCEETHHARHRSHTAPGRSTGTTSRPSMGGCRTDTPLKEDDYRHPRQCTTSTSPSIGRLKTPLTTA